MDEVSSAWLTALSSDGAEQDLAQRRLYDVLSKVTFKECYRRAASTRINGPELDDIAQQAADDAMVSLLAKLDTFRGESRFTTWAYRFAVLEVANKLSRHFWRYPADSIDAADWDHLPAKFGDSPPVQTEHNELVSAVRDAVETLTEQQRHIFISVVINGVPLDAMAVKTGKKHGAIYKTVFDARRKIRTYLTTNGYLQEQLAGTHTSNG